MSKSKIPPHKHCKVCGKVISPDQDYCSSKCEAIDIKQKKEAEFVKKVSLIVIAFFLLAMILSMLRGLGG
ncbi:MAG: DUF2116 family Zn-ribbon domain-containing protein [Thermoprotei archaeon]|nr:MAG: DUF2116 family Zn-ribbon domain-containing protein [Thermoprotei archaeon]RLF00423.1 MAG: DUF2116 family Zn-ribbon domain-containing protein [Thermoprotei archaeon]HDI75230.1 DUF2116 family Zn-ribbon domain-containing protein [Thermoprotei archaeon]